MTKINKILIANRGEIACRVMKTARKLGIKTVAVYSDADKKALHTRMADEAVHIGPSPAAESYLVIDKIINACKQTGADAVHPGYGFLSENPDFVRACDEAGIIFIGPKAESIEAMGLKDAAKKLMVEADVPVTPGYHGEDQTPSVLEAEAKKIGYPVLIKAVAGGGGKGMRKVDAEADFMAALESCQREAKSSFGDDRVLIEKYITSPRHIEVQVFGDTHGNVVHMFERDCSLQRRHQKVIEEAPAPGMTDEVRKAMTDAAVKAAKAVDYVGAGTVEFIVDGSGTLRPDGFWFMEMNTRLQVEHPVSEMITGLDFVELQIRVAEGGKLPAQDEITMEGHAIEARLYAEDPANDFLPSVGNLEVLYLPTYADDGNAIRVDTGVEERDDISIFYDPMIAKVIAFSSNRKDAILELADCLEYAKVIGIRSNVDFLFNLLTHRKFQQFNVDTGFIASKMDELSPADLSNHPKAIALATIALLKEGETKERRLRRYSGAEISPWQERDGWRLNQEHNYSTAFLIDGEVVESKIKKVTDIGYTIQVEDKAYSLHKSSVQNGSSVEHALNFLGAWSKDITSKEIILRNEGRTLRIPRLSFTDHDSLASANALTAPMPGKIIAVNAVSGDTVKVGDPLIIMEAMKMEMTLEAPRDGVVAEVNVEVGALVSDGDVLLEMAEED